MIHARSQSSRHQKQREPYIEISSFQCFRYVILRRSYAIISSSTKPDLPSLVATPNLRRKRSCLVADDKSGCVPVYRNKETCAIFVWWQLNYSTWFSKRQFDAPCLELLNRHSAYASTTIAIKSLCAAFTCCGTGYSSAFTATPFTFRSCHVCNRRALVADRDASHGDGYAVKLYRLARIRRTSRGVG